MCFKVKIRYLNTIATDAFIIFSNSFINLLIPLVQELTSLLYLNAECFHRIRI